MIDSPGPARSPFVSIVVATRNAASCLPRLLDSIALQSWNDYEVVVSDGASTDGTVELLESASRSLPLSFESSPDSGIYDAWNKALGRAAGEWVCFVGADDRFSDPGALADMCAACSRAAPAVGIVYGCVDVVSDAGEMLERHGAPWAETRVRMRALMCLPHPGTMHRRSLFAIHGGFDRKFRIAGDYEWLLRELKVGDAVFVPRVVVEMRFGGMSAQPRNFMESLREVRRAQAMNGIGGLRLPWWLAILRVAVRQAVVRVLGESTARTVMDIGRRLRGLPPLWTRIE